MIQAKLTFKDLTMIVVSLVIGVGIFRAPKMVAVEAQVPAIFFLAWIAGGIVSVCGALTFAEIGARYPQAGGFYRLFSYCYHPAFAFMMNWVLVINNAVACAAVAIIGAEYISPILLPAGLQNQTGIGLIVFVLVGTLYVINLLGIRMGASVQNVLSGLKIALILLFILAIFSPSKPVSMPTNLPQMSLSSAFMAFASCLISVFFSYGGYQQTINFGADVQNPQRDIPKAVFVGMGIVISLYLGINYTYYHVLGWEGLKSSPLLAAELGKALLGTYGYQLTCVVIFISVIGFLNATILSNPRMYYAMAEDKVLPAIFKKINDKTQVQTFGLSFFIGLILISYLLGKQFENIVSYVMIIDTISLAFAAAALFILRKKAKDENISYTGFKMRAYPIIPIIFIVMIGICTISVVSANPLKMLVALALFGLGYPIYYGMRKSWDK